MSKLEKRLRTEWEKEATGCAFPVFLQRKYDKAIEDKQYVLANEIEALIDASRK